MPKFLTGAELIYCSLRHYKVRHVFGYSGGANLPLLDTFHPSNNNNLKPIKFVKSSNEQCSGHTAEGYTKSLGNTLPGVIISTSGPGVTNILTPLQNALNDGTPLIAITGQVATNAIGTDAFQECPATDITRHSCKWNHLLNDVNSIPEIMREGYYKSMDSRMGPVHIDAPKDILMEKSHIKFEDLYSILSSPGKEFRIRNFYIRTYYKNKLDNVEKNLNIYRLSHMILESERPVLKIGQGCNHSYKLVRELSVKYSIPVTTTIHGLGVMDETHDLSLKMVGMHGSAAANIAIQEADLIIAIGTRFDDRTIGNLEKYAPRAIEAGKGCGRGGIVHVDNSQEQINKVSKLLKDKKIMSFYSDSGTFLEDILSTIKSIHNTSYSHNINLNRRVYSKENVADEWINRIKILKRLYPFNKSNYKRDLDVWDITTQDAISSIDKQITNLNIDRDTVHFTTGVGNHQMFAAQHITWTHPGKMITSGSLGTMGVGVPFAIGAKLSNSDNMAICIDGDGSFCMTCSDLQTVAELNIPIKICIMNDSRQQMVHIWQKLFFNGRYVVTDNKNPDFVKLGESYGIKSIKCENVYDLKKTTNYMLRYNEGPILVEYKVKPDICLPLVSPGKALSDMIIDINDLNDINTNINNKNTQAPC